MTKETERSREDALRADLASGHLPHAVLLCGPRGIGKKTLAHEIAMGILCTSEGKRPCGQCKNCRRYQSRSLPDLLLPAPKTGEKTIKTETIRALLDALASAPLEGRRRAVVIENAERMTPAAQNVLLKTLEEVDNSTWFFLTADSLNAILPTILSRCRICRLAPWSDERMRSVLKGAMIPDEEISRLVPLSGGSIGKALRIHTDPAFYEDLDVVGKTFFAVRRPSDIPSALKLLREALKDKKERDLRLLDVLEEQAELLLRSPEDSDAPDIWRSADDSSLKRIMEAVIRAKAFRASNVLFIGCAENIMSVIAEEISLWQL